MSTACDVLRERLGLVAVSELRPGELAAEVQLDQLPAIADRAVASGLRLASLFASDEGAERGFTIHHLWS
ncbi:MAG TPA: hypothetical protein VGK94_09220, partial [Candidatus Polarisedimenticolia bacterium]